MPAARRRQPGLGILLLFYQIFGVIGIDTLPPVTLGVIGLQAAIFLHLFKLPWKTASDICVSAYHVAYKKEFSRLLYGAFVHGDDWHLYYNMVSFALKGRSLERKFGSLKFLYILAVFTLLSNSVLVLLNVFTGGVTNNECAIGFSGVIFALKVLTTYYDHNYTNQIMGIPIVMPARYALWIELLLIQLFVPNASFYGHLAGILVGLAYVKGPLKYLMETFPKSVYRVAKYVLEFPQRAVHVPQREQEQQNYPSFDQYVPPGMSEEEQIRWAMAESLSEDDSFNSFQSLPPSYPGPPSPPPYQGAPSPKPPYPMGNSVEPPHPVGFVPDVLSDAPPPPGFVPDIDELRRRREVRFSH